MARSLFLALLLSATCAASGSEAGKCDLSSESCEGADYLSALQARVNVRGGDDVEQDSMEDSVVEEMEKEDSVVEEMDDSEEDMLDSYELLPSVELDWRDMLTDEGVAFMDSEEAKMEALAIEDEIKDEAAEIEDTADEVEDSSEETEVEEDRGGKGWKRVRKAAKRVVKHVRKALPSFGSLWNQVKRQVKGMNSFPGCSNVNDCKNKLIQGPRQLFNRIANEAGKKINSFINKYVGESGRQVQSALNKGQALIRQTKSKFESMARSMSNALKAASGLRKNLGSMCTPSGVGYISFKGTDCGAFSALSNLVRGRGSLSSVIRSFARCAAKTAFSFMWTPFMDVVIKSFCVPTFIKKPIEYLVGAVEAAFKGGGGVFRQMTDAMKSIGSKLKKMFAVGGFLQDAAAVVGAALHNDTSKYVIDSESKCHGNDFAATIALSGGFTWKAGDKLGVGLTFKQGCWKRKYFADVSFGLAGSMWLGGATPDLKGLDRKLGGGVTLGFKVGRTNRDVVTWAASWDFSGVATVAGVDGALGLGFDILPGGAPPKGFSVTPKFLTCLNEEEERQQEIDAALAQHDNDKDKLVAGVATLLQQFDNLDLTHVAESGAAMLQEGATAMKEKTEEQELAYPMIKDLSMAAGLKIDFCFTCLIPGHVY